MAEEKQPQMTQQKRYNGYMRMHVDEILPGLYLSGCNPAENKEVMDMFKITHIVNMASFVDNQFPDTITYLRIDEEDLAETDLLKYFDSTIEFIDKARNKGGRVLVHCNAGISRAGTMITAYVMKTNKLPMKEAMGFAQNQRKINPIDPNEGFLEQLKIYEDRLRRNKVLK